MGTDIPKFITDVMGYWSYRCDTNEVYLAGGCLAEHGVNDYDIVIISRYWSDELIKFIEDWYRQGNTDDCNIYRAYNQGGDDDDKFHTKAVCHIDGIKVDLLFVDSAKYNINQVLDRFPISIQMQAVGPYSRIIQGSRFCANPIIIYNDTPATEKYRKYYPDRRFIDATHPKGGNRYSEVEGRKHTESLSDMRTTNVDDPFS